MITQAIKEWFHKVFAWWPWKQSPPIEDQHVASAVSRGSAQETPLWISREGTIPQAGATHHRFTLENRVERLFHPRSEVSDMSPLSPPVPFNLTGADPAGNAVESSPPPPGAQQRLEFLRYLVQRGIVNEGFESDRSGPPD